MCNSIYIIGVGRSGTSLIQSMFAAHPDVAYLPETAFIRQYVSKNILERTYRKSGIEVILKILHQDNRLVRLSKKPESILEHALKGNSVKSHNVPLDITIYKSMIHISSSISGSKWFVDKDPKMIEYLKILKNTLPNTHVINIIRDPRDVLASKKKAAWSQRSHVWKHVFANRVQLKIGREKGVEYFYRNYHEIIYENLISNPDVVLKDLCIRIGLSFNNHMLSFNVPAQTLVTEKEMRWKKETLGPLLSSNKDKWRTNLSSREILLTEACCREAMTVGNYKYDKNNHELSMYDRLWLFLGKNLIRFATYPYIIYLKLKRNI